MNSERKYWIWLSQCFPYGSAVPARLLEEYHDACHIYENRHALSKEVRNLTRVQRNALCHSWADDYQSIEEQTFTKGLSMICYGDEEFPQKLKNMDNPPMVLYYLGDLSLLDKRNVAIVGTRKASAYSMKTAYTIASELAKRNIIVVSGCAEGIDTAAHRGALEAGKTISVLGTAMDASYPASNAGLKRAIVDQKGLLITEYPLGTKTNRDMFPIRNRLISAMTEATIVAQAPVHSGSLITARTAMEQGKELFCVPPSDIFDSAYDGVKQLIRDGAHCYFSVFDIEEMYRYHTDPTLQGAVKVRNQEAAPPSEDNEVVSAEYSQDGKLIITALLSASKTMEQLQEITQLPTAQLMGALTELEMHGIIRREGCRYCKKQLGGWKCQN